MSDTETRVCTKCGNEYPLTAEYWATRYGRFIAQCKVCCRDGVMNTNEIASLTNEALLDEIQEWAEIVQDNIANVRQNQLRMGTAMVKKYRLRLENAQTTLAALRAEALRRMPPSLESLT